MNDKTLFLLLNIFLVDHSGERHQVVLRGALWGTGFGMVVPVWSTGDVYAAWIFGKCLRCGTKLPSGKLR